MLTRDLFVLVRINYLGIKVTVLRIKNMRYIFCGSKLFTQYRVTSPYINCGTTDPNDLVRLTKLFSAKI